MKNIKNPLSFIVDILLSRAKLNKGTLKEQYSTVTRIGALIACVLGLFTFYGLQRFEPEIDIEKVNSLGIQISDKQEGEFQLEVKYIEAIY